MQLTTVNIYIYIYAIYHPFLIGMWLVTVNKEIALKYCPMLSSSFYQGFDNSPNNCFTKLWDKNKGRVIISKESAVRRRGRDEENLYIQYLIYALFAKLWLDKVIINDCKRILTKYLPFFNAHNFSFLFSSPFFSTKDEKRL